MKTLLVYIFLFHFAFQLNAQTKHSNWMQSALLWKSYEQQFNQLIEKNHLTQTNQTLINNQEVRLLNYHALANNVKSIQEEIEGISKMTLFVVYWSQDTTHEQLLWSIADLKKDYLLSTTERLANLEQYQFLNYLDQVKSLPQIQTYFQHEKDASSAFLKFGKQPLNQSIPVEEFSGSIAEIILFQQVLPSSERQQIQTYLALKYGIPLAEHYVGMAGEILKEIEDQQYKYRIAGLGRNDFFGLHQKQAKSSIAELSLSIGLGKIEKENALNHNELEEDTYLIWSDNDKSLQVEQRQILEIPSLERLWEMSTSGHISKVSTAIQVDVSNIEFEQDQKLYLVIYEDEKKQQKRYHQAMEISPKGIASFKNIQWDNDQSGKDYFSFALGNDLIPNIKIQFPECATRQNGQVELAAIGGQPPYQFELRTDDGKEIGTWQLENEQESQLIELAVGDYQLTLNDKDGLQYRENFFFQAADAPILELQKQQFLPKKAVMNLNAKLDNSNATYEWKNESGEVLTNQPSVTIKDAGTYYLTLEEEGCVSKHHIEILRFNEERNILSFDVSPNPSTEGHFYLNAQFNQPAESRLNIYDLNGRLLKTRSFDVARFIDCQDDLLENGVYLLELHTRKTKMTRKLIVQRK